MGGKFKECFIHIGTPKTGTTTLQEFFFKNKENLSKKGIFFPESFGKKNHVKLFLSICDLKKGIGNEHWIAGVTNKNLQDDFRNKMTDSFQNELKTFDCTKLLISSETFSWSIREEGGIKSLKEYLDNFAEKFYIIVYLRPQHEFSLSEFKTRLHFGSTEKKILENPDYVNYDYYKLLSHWENVFGTENIIPRIFSKKEFSEGDIKKDFLSILGLEFSDFDDIKNLNEGINTDAQRFLLGINRYVPMFINGKRNRLRGDIGEKATHGRTGKGMLPTRQEALTFFNHFEKSNEEVRGKWFPDREELFEIDFTKYPEEEQYPEIDYPVFEIFGELWSHNQTVNLANDYIMKGQMCIINEQYEKALSHLEKALKIRPKHTMILQSLSHVLMKLQRFKDSEKYLNKAIMLEPNNPQLRKLQEKLETSKND